jgi:hypothetical protein
MRIGVVPRNAKMETWVLHKLGLMAEHLPIVEAAVVIRFSTKLLSVLLPVCLKDLNPKS